jgi:hypothetical protein
MNSVFTDYSKAHCLRCVTDVWLIEANTSSSVSQKKRLVTGQKTLVKFPKMMDFSLRHQGQMGSGAHKASHPKLVSRAFSSDVEVDGPLT